MKHPLKMRSPWQRFIFHILVSKHHKYNFRKSHKVSRNFFVVLELCFKNHRGGEKDPHPSPNSVKSYIRMVLPLMAANYSDQCCQKYKYCKNSSKPWRVYSKLNSQKGACSRKGPIQSLNFRGVSSEIYRILFTRT